MSQYLTIPKEVESITVKVKIIAAEPQQVFDPVYEVNKEIAVWTRHLTFYYHYQSDNRNKADVVAFQTPSGFNATGFWLGRNAQKPVAPKVTIQTFHDPGVGHNFSEGYPNLKHIEWDITRVKNDYSLPNQPLKLTTAFIVSRSISWNDLKLDPRIILTNYKGSNRFIGYFENVLDDCRSLRLSIASVVLKFSMGCFKVKCVTHPDVAHEFEADYILKLDDRESIRMNGIPRWFVSAEARTNHGGCQCEAEFQGLDITKVF